MTEQLNNRREVIDMLINQLDCGNYFTVYQIITLYTLYILQFYLLIISYRKLYKEAGGEVIKIT